MIFVNDYYSEAMLVYEHNICEKRYIMIYIENVFGYKRLNFWCCFKCVNGIFQSSKVFNLDSAIDSKEAIYIRNDSSDYISYQVNVNIEFLITAAVSCVNIASVNENTSNDSLLACGYSAFSIYQARNTAGAITSAFDGYC
uniref:Uncharacterized protein n=1 Tax=Rhabditophanes sp. KR3021 TaxID=114890 RepID=A0AC35TVL8_9BILA